MDISVCFMGALLGAAGAWGVSRLAGAGGLMDVPNERSSHTVPTPKGGGLGILAAFCWACAAGGMDAGFYLPAVLVSLVSLWGDRTAFSPMLRLAVQCGCAALFLLSAEIPPVLWPFLILFIAGSANFYNFMDGINGIAGITGVVGFGLLALFAALNGGEGGLSSVMLCIVFSCLGFLPFNIPSARVFMGDVGSVLLGFVFALTVVELSGSFTEFMVLCCFLMPFYADELTTMFLRLRDGENLARPHRRHLYQLLANEKGAAHWKISLGYGIFQLGAGLAVLWAGRMGTAAAGTAAAVFFCGFAALSKRVRETVEQGDDMRSKIRKVEIL